MKKSKFYHALQKTGSYLPEEIALLVNSSIIHEISKGETILKQGDVCSSCFFVEQGAFYQYEINKDIEKSIINLYLVDDWVLNILSFTQREPSQHTITAYTKGLLYELKIDVIHSLLEKHPSFIQLGKILSETPFKTALLHSKMTPQSKYLYLVKNKPELLQAFPLFMIASFLKISPETLSRVRGRSIS